MYLLKKLLYWGMREQTCKTGHTKSRFLNRVLKILPNLNFLLDTYHRRGHRTMKKNYIFNLQHHLDINRYLDNLKDPSAPDQLMAISRGRVVGRID